MNMLKHNWYPSVTGGDLENSVEKDKVGIGSL